MCANLLLLALFSVLMLGIIAASDKHEGRTQTTVTPRASNTTVEFELASARRTNSARSYDRDSESPLRTPLAVYTLPLSARVSLTPLGMRSLDQVYNTCSTYEENSTEMLASQVVYKQLVELTVIDIAGYIKYSNEPEMMLKYFLVKATWNDAQAACASDSAALYTFDHPAQLDSAMANFYPLLLPWVDVQKARVEGGSTLCGYLHGPTSGKSSLRWDDCNAMHEFICQKSANTPSKPTSLNIRGNTKITPRTTNVLLSDFLNAFNTASQAFYNLVNPGISLALLSPILTLAQKTEISTIMAQWQNFVFVVMPGVNIMVTTTPILSPMHIQKIQNAATDGLALYTQFQILSNTYSAQLVSLSVDKSLPFLNMIGESITFFNILARIVSNPLAQPTITTAQALTLNNVIAQSQSIYNAAVNNFNIFTAASTTAAPTTTVNPIPPLAEIIQTLLTTAEAFYITLLPFLSVAEPLTLMPSMTAQLQAFFSQSMDFTFTKLPSVVSMLSVNPLLTAAEVEQLKDAIDRGIILQISSKCFGNLIGSQLNFSPVQKQALFDNGDRILALYAGIQEVVYVSNNLPTISATQFSKLQTLLAQYQGAFIAIANVFTTTSTTGSTMTTLSTTLSTAMTTTTLTSVESTTSSTTASTTTLTTTTHVLTPAERNVIIGQIQGYMAQMDALLLMLLSPPVALRTTAAQLKPPEVVINKLLTLRTRQAEIETLVRTMSAHEQKEISSKLEASRERLRKMTSDQKSFAQNLTVITGNVQPITQLLEHTVEILQPFF